jgi:hypothetical protein
MRRNEQLAEHRVQERSTMRNTLWILGVLIGLAVAPPQAQADDWFWGFKLAYFEADEDQGVDDPDNAGLTIGYDWSVKYGSLGVEAELTSTFEEGDFAGEDVEVDSGGVYATYRTRGPHKAGIGPYLKFKAGAAYTDVTLGSDAEDETNASVGIGVGFNMVAVQFELDYTTLTDDIDMVSLAVRF